MPAKKSETRKPLPQWEFKGYVKADLQKSERVDFGEWSLGQTAEDVFDWMCSVAEDGYKVILGVNKAGICASMHNVDGEPHSRGFILTAYADTLNQACTLLMYKHVHKLDGHWPTSDEDGDMGLR